jgi:peptide/nickel transport system substrate-binding protein
MKSVALVLLCIVSMVAVLASCSGSTTTTPATTTTSTKTTTATTSTPATTTTSSSEPQYGGTFTTVTGTDPMGFDEAYTFEFFCSTLKVTNQELLMGDWLKGPAGSNSIDWLTGYVGRTDVLTGCLAESWELKDDTTVVFHLRKGIHYALNSNSEASKLVNAREVVADDVVFSETRTWETPSSLINILYAPNKVLQSIKALDKYTVEIKVPSAYFGLVWLTTAEQCRIIPPEVVNKYGDMKDWKNSVGTGPYILTDFISASSITYKRNPNYWQMDPLYPKNQLPYPDEYKELIISDTSTQQAAFRTGKIDIISNMTGGLTYDDFKAIINTNPKSQYVETSGSHPALWGRLDKPELPFKDIKVRQALNMAINKQDIVDSYYKGHADLFSPIFPNNATYSPFTTPLDQMPQEVKDLFTYNTEKAKELLKEAGYPNGFTTQIICQESDADFLAVIAADLAKVNITLQIKQMETGVFNSMARGRTYDQMVYKESTSRGFPYDMNEVNITNSDDAAFYESDVTNKAYTEVQLYFGRDDAKWQKIIKDVYPYIIAQSPGIWLPSPSAYKLFQPWLKGWHGESNVGFDNPYGWIAYPWIDKSLK